MARPDAMYEGDSPFLLEALDPGPADEMDEELVTSLAGLARRMPRRRRQHVERALVRHLADRGRLDRGAIAGALTSLRGRLSELGEEEALESVEQEHSACSGGASCAHEAEMVEECGPQSELDSAEWEAGEEGEEAYGEGEALELGAEVASEEAAVETDVSEALFETDASDGSEGEVPFRDETLDEVPFRDETGDEAGEHEAPLGEALEPASAFDELAGLNQLYEDREDLAQDEELEEFEDLESELPEHVEMEGEAPSTADIQRCLAAVTVVRSQPLTLRQAPNPFDLNAIASRNSPEKRGMFKPLQSTWASLRKVEAALAKSPSAQLKAKRDALVRRRDEQAAALKEWVRRHPLDHSRKRTQLKSGIAALEKRLRKLKGRARSAAEADLAARKSALRTLEEALQAAALSYEPLKDVVQSHCEVRVAGRAGPVSVRLHDHVIAFATDTAGGFEGHAVNDAPGAVAEALKRSGLGASKQSMLRVLSSLEGYFSSVNTWDRAVVTFGFIQWTTDEAAEGTLCKLMAEIRSQAPDAYARCFQCHGLDLQGRYFKVTREDGSSLVGPEAARHVQTSLKHVAALSAAGMDADVQAVQVRFAAETKIDAMLARKLSARGKSVKLGDLLTSDYAVAVMMDRATGTGENGTRGTAERAFGAYLKAHPDADFSASAERAAAGAAVLRALEGLDRERASKYAALNRDAGSYSA
jgi:hypothetical protein